MVFVISLLNHLSLISPMCKYASFKNLLNVCQELFRIISEVCLDLLINSTGVKFFLLCLYCSMWDFSHGSSSSCELWCRKPEKLQASATSTDHLKAQHFSPFSFFSSLSNPALSALHLIYKQVPGFTSYINQISAYTLVQWCCFIPFNHVWTWLKSKVYTRTHTQTLIYHYNLKGLGLKKRLRIKRKKQWIFIFFFALIWL